MAFRSDFDQLPEESMHIIKEKVRQGCLQSFQALEGTSRELRDCVRRCTTCLVVQPWNESRITATFKTKKVQTVKKRAAGAKGLECSRRSREVLAEEITRRSSLSKLVLVNPGYFSMERTDISVLGILSKFPWSDCFFDGLLKHGNLNLTRWGPSRTKIILPSSKTSLRKLTLVNFKFSLSKSIVALLQALPKLISLTPGGEATGKGGSYVKHESLSELNILDLEIWSEYARQVITTAALSSRALPGVYLAFNLPHLQKLSVTLFRGGPSFNLRAPRFTFPNELETLILHYVDWPSIDHSFRLNSFELYSQLAKDCPQLRELQVKLDGPHDNPGVEQARQWISEQQGIPQELSLLEELSIYKYLSKRGRWELVKSVFRSAVLGS